ncbi:hypothetical protein BOTBODRAFT_29104 [Botryobasidium botryosum FD-172 SS1]|uniref:NAD(P)-binding protein n=1 Tax=Botryobasidium botryosum (strain FD-172 SS1) TaxID=930990 RepID=A0A067MSL1_BOTB1|nr:hypothetical protein BOTBODRAFT_29104 [Botryobasidium botryosum FD-172 SS1]
MVAPTVYLVSGANRGIGLGLVTALASRDNVVVFAGARNPPAAKDLHALAEKYPGRLYIVKLTSSDKPENEAAIAEIKAIAGKLDVVIANAGISQFYGTALATPIEEMRIHYEVNVIGTLVLFQAAWPLLKMSASPTFIPISSGAGSITEGAGTGMGVTAYGVSKAGLNYLARKLHFEHPELICFPMSPGAVTTDLAANAARSDDIIKAIPAMTVEESTTGILKVLGGATREKDGGKFLHYNGSVRAW